MPAYSFRVKGGADHGGWDLVHELFVISLHECTADCYYARSSACSRRLGGSICRPVWCREPN